MRLNKFWIIISATAITIAGCKNAKQQDADSALNFPEEATAKWSYISNDEIIPRPKDFIVSDSSIYVVAFMGDYWLHEFKKDAPSEAVSTIRNGQGPDELINASGMTLSDNDSLKNFFDFDPRIFKTYDRDNNVVNQIDLKKLKVNIRDAWHLKGNQCLISSYTSIIRGGLPVRSYLLADLDSMNIISRYEYLDESLLNYIPNLMRPADTVLSPDGKHFASGTTYGGILEFFSISDNSIEQSFFKVLFPFEWHPKPNTPIEDPLFGFTALCATNELVYGAFLGSKDDRKPTDIGVWKWDGKPVKLIHTDATVLALDIDEKTNTLYAVTFNQETGPQLAKMKL